MKAPSNYPCVFSSEVIDQMVSRLAREIERDFPVSEKLVLVGVLKGAWIFHAALAKVLNREVTIDFIKASSYGDQMQSSGVVKIDQDLSTDVSGKSVLLVEDIIDTGRTLKQLCAYVKDKGAKRVALVTLLDKKCKRIVECEADYVGAEIEDVFVVGYGLDWAERFRNLDGIYAVPSEASVV